MDFNNFNTLQFYKSDNEYIFRSKELETRGGVIKNIIKFNTKIGIKVDNLTEKLKRSMDERHT